MRAGLQKHNLNKTGNVRVTLRGILATTVVVEKAKSVSYSECIFVALCIQQQYYL